MAKQFWSIKLSSSDPSLSSRIYIPSFFGHRALNANDLDHCGVGLLQNLLPQQTDSIGYILCQLFFLKLWKKLATRYILQNSPGGLFVLRVSATDEDLGYNARITYSLEGTALAL